MMTMKLVPVAAPLLAVTIVPTIADSAAAYPTESIKDGLKAAICAQDWDQAISLSGNLIASSEITPEHRQTLVDWRHRFSNYAKGQVKFDNMPNCQRVQRSATEIRVTPYQAPRFSKTSAAANLACYMRESGGRIVNLEYMCGDGPYIPLTPPAPPEPPVVLSNGDLECSFLGEISSRSAAGTGEVINVPAVCIALQTVNGATVRVQLKADNRVLGTHTESVSYIEAGETYAYDATFTTDYAADSSAAFTPRFIP